MARFVEQDVRRRARAPSESRSVDLLIGYGGEVEAVEALVEDLGGRVGERLPYRSVTASVPESALEQLIEAPAVETVERDTGMETLQGN